MYRGNGFVSHTGSGGLVLDHFDDETLLYDNVFLISDRTLRTKKYMQALISGIACVTPLWLREVFSCAGTTCHMSMLTRYADTLFVDGEVPAFEPYLLPASSKGQLQQVRKHSKIRLNP